MGQFRICQGTDVEPGHWGGHQVSIELTCHIMFYNQLPTADTIPKFTVAPEVVQFHIGAVTDVELGHWVGHQVSGHERCVKSDFIFKRHLLTPFTSGPWLNKWAGSEMVWNPDTGVDTKCPAMKPMCQIMFYNQLPTSDTIHKWTLTPEVGRFKIGARTDVEPGH